GNLSGEFIGAGCEEAQGRRGGVAARLDGQPEVIGGIVRVWIDGEAPRWAVLEALVYGQDDEPARAGEASVIHDAGEIGAGARVLAVVPGEDLFHARFHDRPSFLEWLPAVEFFRRVVFVGTADEDRHALVVFRGLDVEHALGARGGSSSCL